MDPTSDLVDSTLQVTANQIGLANTAPRWTKYTKGYADFSIASTTSADNTIVSLGAGAVVHLVKVITTTGFTGVGVTAANLSVGITSSDPDDYINDTSVFAATTTAGGEYTGTDFLAEDGATPILCQLKTVTANIDQLTAGSVDVWIFWSIADSAL
jgi:hypothetical protein